MRSETERVISGVSPMRFITTASKRTACPRRFGRSFVVHPDTQPLFDPAEGAPGAMASVLLHSLTFYVDLIEGLAAVPSCPDIVEIGSESGEMSVVLAAAAAVRGGTL